MRYFYYDHTTRQYELPESGSLIVAQHKVYRVVELKPIDEVDWTEQEREGVRARKRDAQHKFVPVHIVLRPIEFDSGDVRARDHDLHYRTQFLARQWNVYRDEHYPVCSKCGEPTPCREVLGKEEAERAVERMSRYEDPNKCPACGEGFTRRQKKHTFQENIEIPGGAPVTFHLRGGCRHGAAEYEKRLLKNHPDRLPELHCSGHVTNHNDGTYECTAGDRCPGPEVDHPSWSVCGCQSCHATGSFGCHPLAWASRRTA